MEGKPNHIAEECTSRDGRGLRPVLLPATGRVSTTHGELLGLFLELNSCLFSFFPEFTMTVKETYCSVTDLVPNTQYEFWVTAQNRAGPSPASERAVYMTGNGAHLGRRSHGFLDVAGPSIWQGRDSCIVFFH